LLKHAPASHETAPPVKTAGLFLIATLDAEKTLLILPCHEAEKYET